MFAWCFMNPSNTALLDPSHTPQSTRFLLLLFSYPGTAFTQPRGAADPDIGVPAMFPSLCRPNGLRSANMFKVSVSMQILCFLPQRLWKGRPPAREGTTLIISNTIACVYDICCFCLLWVTSIFFIVFLGMDSNVQTDQPP